MAKKLEPGLAGSHEAIVTEAMLASNVGSGTVSVFSTAMLVALLEGTAVALVQDALEEGQTTVGTAISVSHTAATPLGMKVRFFAELKAISPNGKGLTFRVRAEDEAGSIGEGSHERVIVNKEKFETRTLAKRQREA